MNKLTENKKSLEPGNFCPSCQAHELVWEFDVLYCPFCGWYDDSLDAFI